MAGSTSSAANAAVPTLAEHLNNIIDRLTQFKNKVDLPRRETLFDALREVQSEAQARGVAMGGTIEKNAEELVKLPSAGRLLDAIGVREMPGFGQYHAGDPRWAESLLEYYQTALLIDSGNRPVQFPTHNQRGIDGVQRLVAKQPITIAIAGDWGSGDIDGRPSPAAAIAGHIEALKPDYTIHLGDVYYAGLEVEERNNFLKRWPGATGAYALNSNHEMYCGGVGYFKVLLADPKFKSQQGLSYFALTNENWLIIGLDTAFFAYHQSLLYEQGSLSDPRERDGTIQIEWMSELLKQHAGKRVILLTHHDGFDIDPLTGAVTFKPLYQAVIQQLKGVRDLFWYWGHVHTVIAYQQIILNQNSTFSARCVGHGAIPYEPFPKDFTRLGNRDVRVRWAETRPANNAKPARAFNGFLLLTLSGADLKEEFYDELGNQCWSNV
jgi:calcineurin-like phosphoesterase family protein